ncbi:hypothetical protein [Nocardia crassostreae]|uniref:hypothetical protein n=1 Tax=Nocardia crassostreae TaxID=53428 RepID=UPI00082F868F|nr:hypothetical protein [Nocardia crassostreae]
MTLIRYAARHVDTTAAVLTLVAGFSAIWAFASALGLAGGGIDLGSTVVQRLPFDSPVFAGIALLLVVGLPMSLAAVLAALGDRRAPAAAVTAGVLLIGWIIVQLIMIREFFWLQPVCVAFGLAVLMLGLVQRGRVRAH